MKKIWKYLVMLIIANTTGQNCEAQITLDTILTSANTAFFFTPVQISSTETKYYVADVVANTFNLYNMDFSPFLMNVAVPEPFLDSIVLFQAIYITRSLCNVPHCSD